MLVRVHYLFTDQTYRRVSHSKTIHSANRLYIYASYDDHTKSADCSAHNLRTVFFIGIVKGTAIEVTSGGRHCVIESHHKKSFLSSFTSSPVRMASGKQQVTIAPTYLPGFLTSRFKRNIHVRPHVCPCFVTVNCYDVSRSLPDKQEVINFHD